MLNGDLPVARWRQARPADAAARHPLSAHAARRARACATPSSTRPAARRRYCRASGRSAIPTRTRRSSSAPRAVAEHDFAGSARRARHRRAAAAACPDAARPGLEHERCRGRGRSATSRLRAARVPLRRKPPISPPTSAGLMDFIESEEVDPRRARRARARGARRPLAADRRFPQDRHRALAAASRATRVSSRRSRGATRSWRMEADAARPTVPAGPVIAAGSTGTVPATARLLEVIASLPNGAVVLPGLDLSLDDEELGEPRPSTPSTRKPAWPSCSPSSACDARRGRLCSGQRARCIACARGSRFVSEVLRPAESTERWQRFLVADELSADGRASFANALAGIRVVDRADRP